MISIKLILFLTFFLTKLVFSDDSAELDRLENLINTGSQNAADYVLPTDAKQFEATNNNIQEYGSFDFVIIGCGSSGSVIASRLSEIGDWNILVIEAGTFSDNGFIQFPRFFALHSFSDYNWGYKTVPQTTSCLGTVDKTSYIHLGKGVGGTSLLHPVIYSRGHPENYNNWANTLLDSSWSYKNLLKYFKQSENFHWTNPNAPVNIDYHGNNGEFDVQHRTPDYFLNKIFLDANEQLGYKITDYNGPSTSGASILQLNTRKGVKLDTGTAFVKPVLTRSNLVVLTESFVTKIEIDPLTKEAESVLFTRAGNTFRARSNKEIILAAGAIGSPKILMLSGVGPKTHLSDLGINVIQNLEVGSNLKDHASASALVFTTNVIRPIDTFRAWLKDYIKGEGDLTGVSRVQAIGYYPVGSTNKQKAPTLEIRTDIALKSKMVQKYTDVRVETAEEFWGSNYNAVSFVLNLQHPKSSGTLRLKSKNPFDYPVINPKYLSDSNDEDIELMYQGIKFVFDLAETEAYRRIGLKYLGNPVSGCKDLIFKSRDYWYCFLRQVTISAYQPSSTCPMGTNMCEGGVVDSKLRVFNIKWLRVADASVFPDSIPGNPVTSSVMIGEKISDDLKQQYFFI